MCWACWEYGWPQSREECARKCSLTRASRASRLSASRRCCCWPRTTGMTASGPRGRGDLGDRRPAASPPRGRPAAEAHRRGGGGLGNTTGWAPGERARLCPDGAPGLQSHLSLRGSSSTPPTCCPRIAGSPPRVTTLPSGALRTPAGLLGGGPVGAARGGRCAGCGSAPRSCCGQLPWLGVATERLQGGRSPVPCTCSSARPPEAPLPRAMHLPPAAASPSHVGKAAVVGLGGRTLGMDFDEVLC